MRCQCDHLPSGRGAHVAGSDFDGDLSDRQFIALPSRTSLSILHERGSAPSNSPAASAFRFSTRMASIPTMYLTDAPNVRMREWVGAVPDYVLDNVERACGVRSLLEASGATVEAMTYRAPFGERASNQKRRAEKVQALTPSQFL
jgi:hypothetical protein